MIEYMNSIQERSDFRKAGNLMDRLGERNWIGREWRGEAIRVCLSASLWPGRDKMQTPEDDVCGG